jgi:putative transposase
MKGRESSHAERVAIIERHQAGESLTAIAAELGYSYFTVRKWWRTYRRQGWVGLEPKAKGPPQVGRLGRFAPLVKYVLLRLKRQHPGWGVDKLLLELTRRPSLKGQALPKRSAVCAYLASFGTRLRPGRRLRTRRPVSTHAKASEPHQCWQMDFKGEELVGGCRVTVSPLMLCDEASGAPLSGFVHTVKAVGQRTGLNTRHVQADLRQAFERWGLPDALRMDRDRLFVGCSRLQWPGPLLLWLVGLRVQPVINRAYRPTDNATVERNHWTWEQHVLLGQSYPQVEQVQHATDQSFADRREYLPSRHVGCNGRPPAEAFPTLRQPRRPYTSIQEQQLFDLQRVDAYLSQWEWRRTVSSQGRISLADRNYSVGAAYRGQVVKIRFDAQAREFVCSHVAGHPIARFTVPEVSQDYILGITQSDDMGTT